MATALVDAGYLISFALPVSFPKNIGPREAAAAIPATNLLVETDSPYLGVSKDVRNEPTTVLRTAAVLARLRDTDPGANRRGSSDKLPTLPRGASVNGTLGEVAPRSRFALTASSRPDTLS